MIHFDSVQFARDVRLLLEAEGKGACMRLEQAGVGPSPVSQLRRGRAVERIEVMLRVCEHFDLPLSNYLHRTVDSA